MKALCWHGRGDIRCDEVPDPKIEDGRDVVIKMTACAICGSDLHLMDGYIPFMEKGDILGHEFMGEVVEVGKDNETLLLSAAVNASSASKGTGRSASEATGRPTMRPGRLDIRWQACSATLT
jgi:threonine dehydrogenase-like Zn-dependent dehydrogenase